MAGSLAGGIRLWSIIDPVQTATAMLQHPPCPPLLGFVPRAPGALGAPSQQLRPLPLPRHTASSGPLAGPYAAPQTCGWCAVDCIRWLVPSSTMQWMGIARVGSRGRSQDAGHFCGTLAQQPDVHEGSKDAQHAISTCTSSFQPGGTCHSCRHGRRQMNGGDTRHAPDPAPVAALHITPCQQPR